MPANLSEQEMRKSGYLSLGLALVFLVLAIYLLAIFSIEQHQLYLTLP